MKKRFLLGAAGLAVLALASCTPSKPNGGQPSGGDQPTLPSLEGKTLNVYVNYKGTTGVTFTGKYAKIGTSYTNPIDGQTYVAGDLLPMWKEVQNKLGVTIKDAVTMFEKDSYTAENENAVYSAIGEDANISQIDILMTNSANANKYATAGKLANLAKYLKYMPNLSAFLESHPAIKDELTNDDGQMYIAPYFDGVDTIEKMFLFNTELVEKLLDEEGAYDETAITNGGQYTPFIDTSKDYVALVSVNGVGEDITVKAATNPVQAQNELATKNGKTYVEALKAYIDAAYMPSGKYQKRSEVFTSEAACYTVDDMIALLRCAVNNSVYLYGEAGKVHGVIPRGQANNRIITILQLAQIWGVQGLTAETDYLYFDKDGNLCDARTTAATYDALERLHTLKAEGLIIDGWETEGKNGTYFTSNFLSGKQGAALMIYDYNATQTVWNNVSADSNGIGQADSKYTKIMPVLPPLTKWENNNISDAKYTYTRYTEDSRAFKGSGSVVMAKDDEAQIIAACQLIDFFYGEEGAQLQDYGPEAYRDGTITVAGVTYPKIKSSIFSDAAFKAAGWNDWYRACVGSTQGIGHVRSDGLDYQVTHDSGKTGLANILSAIKSGAVVCATTSRTQTFGATVPAKWDSNPETTNIATLVDFWKQGMSDAAWRSVVNHGWSNELSRSTLEALFETSNSTYLQHYKDLLA